MRAEQLFHERDEHLPLVSAAEIRFEQQHAHGVIVQLWWHYATQRTEHVTRQH